MVEFWDDVWRKVESKVNKIFFKLFERYEFFNIRGRSRMFLVGKDVRVMKES